MSLKNCIYCHLIPRWVATTYKRWYMMTSLNGNFPRYWPFVRGIHWRSPVNPPHKGQWRGALMFSLICVWINGRVNNREAGDLRRHHADYNVTVMGYQCGWLLMLVVSLWKTESIYRNMIYSLNMSCLGNVCPEFTPLPQANGISFFCCEALYRLPLR